MRSALDVRDDKIGAKIRDAHSTKPVYYVVIGEKEQESKTVAVKSRDADLGSLSLDEFVARCVAEAKAPFGG